ncbi:MerR family transcriptional regulator [Thalassotalea sp. ND16A]|uniref:MerR family transcriptional regulator n=1 Tax=Thalassotalea sp. ND16A TaxID=1535422 RepID=UPI000519EF37|nr:helix-turn-helix domain-containing protein [Thalassotalea sp. ND16A]KGJ99188.1 putative transcriptional regulator, MerR family [Thalassotalea sp. ND16A]
MGFEKYSIGQLSKKSGCKVETVHYYERIELMPEPPRTEGGHRVYSLTHVKRLNFIRRSRELGFKIEQIRELLKFIDEPNHYCGEVRAMAMQQSRVVQEKILDLQRLQSALDEMVTHCKGNQNSIDDCPIVDALFTENRDGIL